MMVASSGSLVPGNIIVTESESDWGQPVAIAIVTLVGLQVDEVLELLHLGQPLPGVVGETQVLQLVLGVKAEQDGVKDVHIDQGARLVRVAVSLLGLVLWGMKKLVILKNCKKIKRISPFQTRLATYLMASR